MLLSYRLAQVLTWRCDSNKSVHKVVCLSKYIHHGDVEGVRRSTEVEHIDGLWQCTCVYEAVILISTTNTETICSLNLRQKDTFSSPGNEVTETRKPCLVNTLASRPGLSGL